VNRGLKEPDEASRFLNPTLENLANPFQMKDMEKAVLRVARALREGESITLYGDYDVDGTTGSSLLYLFLRELNGKVEVYIPHRLREGYGLNTKALEEIRRKGSQLVITVDNGITSVQEAKFAKELQLDLIIIDHHQVPPTLPIAVAILNPKQKDCDYPYKELAAVGVAFQFALALRNHLRKEGFFQERTEPNLKKYLDLVALGTIADVVPLTGQNRILVKEGLKILSESQNLGIRALKEVSGVRGPVTPGQVGFRLGPRINAAGRLDSARVGFELLTTHDETRARTLAEQLDTANRERQELEEQILREAFERIESQAIHKHRRSILIFDPKWHIGVVGIVASRLVERYHLPTLVGSLEGEKIRCSARSISGFDLFKALQECQNHLEKFGGHRQAAGLTLSIEKKDAFWDAFDQIVRSQLSEEQFVPRIRVDTELEADTINENLVEELQRLAPFGQANPEPIFWAKKIKALEKRQVGTNHLKLTLKANKNLLDAIGFGMGDFVVHDSSSLECVFSCQFNEWQGDRKIQLRLLDFPRNL
jgi:single-stranded-DNA-specific exonuclease